MIKGGSFNVETFERDLFVRVQCLPEVLFIVEIVFNSVSGNASKGEGGDHILENLSPENQITHACWITRQQVATSRQERRHNLYNVTKDNFKKIVLFRNNILWTENLYFG